MKAEQRASLRSLWGKRIRNWQQSGLTQTEWCRQNQLSLHLLSYWKRKLLPARGGSKLIPIVVHEQESLPVPDKVIIHLPSGIRIEADTTQVSVLMKQREAL